MAEVCDCDLNVDPHRPNRDHYRACKAPFEHDGLTVTCQVIRGHTGKHWTVYTREVRWDDGSEAIFGALE
jgi:hypothetical protein